MSRRRRPATELCPLEGSSEAGYLPSQLNYVRAQVPLSQRLCHRPRTLPRHSSSAPSNINRGFKGQNGTGAARGAQGGFYLSDAFKLEPNVAVTLAHTRAGYQPWLQRRSTALEWVATINGLQRLQVTRLGRRASSSGASKLDWLPKPGVAPITVATLTRPRCTLYCPSTTIP